MDRLIQAILVLLKAQFTTTFKKYQYGDQKVYNRTLLPMLCVIPGSMSVSNSGTVRDEINHTVTIRVIVDMKKYLALGGTDIQSAEQALVKFMENTDANGELLDASIVAVIRSNMDISGHTLYSDSLNVNYEDENIETENTILKKADLEISFSKRGIRNT